ncbi:MAG: hypothetical protein QXS93_01275 [Candidatus Micrarchaeia archaeon]
MAGPSVTLSDIYIKLEEIEERLERLEQVLAKQQRAQPVVNRFDLQPSPKKYHYIQRSAPLTKMQAPAGQKPASQASKEPDKKIDLKNWRYLLGLE